MNSFIKNVPPLTPEQIAEIEALSKMSDDEIDYSDIPKITHEEWVKNFRPTRLRKKNLKIASKKKSFCL